MKYDYDVAVLGGGAAGLTAAGMAASLGAKTILIEENKLGGDCTWTGCVPSKTLLAQAKKIHTASEVTNTRPNDLFEFSELMDKIHSIQEGIYEEADSPKALEKFGVETKQKKATLSGKHALILSGESGSREEITARFIFIATGADPIVPPIDGLGEVEYETSNTVFTIDKQPDRLGIIGGGPIGVELGQAFARLGTDVTIFESSESILSRNADQLTQPLTKKLQDDGVSVRTGGRVVEVTKSDTGKQVHTSNEEALKVDVILLAVGRVPQFENLNTEAASVKTDKAGIPTNSCGQTNQSHIYAIGDVTQGPRFTHQSEQEAKSAVLRALYKLPVSNQNPIPRVVYTEPELAAVGQTEKKLKEDGTDFDTYTFPNAKLDRAITEQKTNGEIRIYTPEGGSSILGAEVLGARAGEAINELSVAMEEGVSMRDLAQTVHPYPTFNQVIRRCADQFMVRNQPIQLMQVAKWLFGYQGSIFQPDDDQII